MMPKLFHIRIALIGMVSPSTGALHLTRVQALAPTPSSNLKQAVMCDKDGEKHSAACRQPRPTAGSPPLHTHIPQIIHTPRQPRALPLPSEVTQHQHSSSPPPSPPPAFCSTMLSWERGPFLGTPSTLFSPAVTPYFSPQPGSFTSLFFRGSPLLCTHHGMRETL